MIGRRLPDGEQQLQHTRPGDYWKNEHGWWYAETPNGLLGNLKNHQVTEHEDGTITVSPSIQVDSSKPDTWHGYLERGVWRSCCLQTSAGSSSTWNMMQFFTVLPNYEAGAGSLRLSDYEVFRDVIDFEMVLIGL